MNIIKKICTWSTTPPDANNLTRANNFNIIRIVASIMVIYGHMSALMGVSVFSVYNQAVSTIAVKIFFIISGYLITKSFMSDSNFASYMIKRIFRIFPGLIAVVLFAAVIVGPIFTSLPLNEYISNPGTRLYLRNMILYPIYSLPGVFENYTYPNAVNGSLWSLPVEFAMYLLLPLLVVIFKKLKVLKPGLLVTALFFLAIDVLKIARYPSLRYIFWGNNLPDWLSLIPFFFIGSFFSFNEFKKYLNLQLATALLVAGSLISVDYAKSEILLFITLPYFVLSFALCEKPLFCGWFKKCDFSYGLYLYGFVIQQILYNALKKYNPSLNVMTVISLAVTLIFAILSWYLVEKPMQKLGGTIVKKLKKPTKLK